MANASRAARRRRLTSDPDASASRRAALASYLERRVLGKRSGFRCVHANACRRSAGASTFYEGQLSYVGDHYELTDRTRALRVLIVGMERGGEDGYDEHVGMERRHDEVMRHLPPRSEPLNLHMRGTLRQLAIVFGLFDGLGETDGMLLTTHGDVHVFEAFALVNCTLCSAVRTETKKRDSMTTRTMRINCQPHLRRTVELLAPTLVITQGKNTHGSFAAAIGGTLSEVPLPAQATALRKHAHPLVVADSDAGSIVWARLHHPSYWMRPPATCAAYYHEVVVPTLTAARDVALSPA